MNLILILLQAAPRQQTGATNYSGILMLLIIGLIIYFFVKVRSKSKSMTPIVTEQAINSDLKWHQKPIATILFLIFFFPVGLYLMWKNEMWSKQSRWIITSIFLILIVVNLNKSNNYNSASDLNSTSKRKITQYEAEAFIQNKCNERGLTLMKTKTAKFQDYTIYSFLCASNDGSVCVYAVSEIPPLEVLACDCGSPEEKIEQWNQIQ